MATTTLKLPEDLKARITPLAAAAGKSPHAWMVDAIRAQIALSDMKASFLGDGRQSAADIDSGGSLYAMEDVAAYLRARLADKNVERPGRLNARGTAFPTASPPGKRRKKT